MIISVTPIGNSNIIINPETKVIEINGTSHSYGENPIYKSVTEPSVKSVNMLWLDKSGISSFQLKCWNGSIWINVL